MFRNDDSAMADPHDTPRDDPPSRTTPPMERSAGRAMVTTSWDDGHPQDLRLADLLESHGIPATFYIPQANPLNGLPVLEAAQVRSLSDRGFEIGAHTLHHIVLTDTPNDKIREEIVGSKAWVSDVTGRDCPMFCPPCGRHTAGHVEMIRDAGFIGYRTVELWSTDRPRAKGRGLVEMPTGVQAMQLDPTRVVRNLLKRRAVGNAWRYFKHGRSGDWTDHAKALLDHAIATDGVFHLWGHSWELQDHDEWERLDAVLAHLADHADRIDFGTNAQVCEALRPTPTDAS